MATKMLDKLPGPFPQILHVNSMYARYTALDSVVLLLYIVHLQYCSYQLIINVYCTGYCYFMVYTCRSKSTNHKITSVSMRSVTLLL